MAWSLGTVPRFSIGISPSNASADRLAGMSVARSLSAFVPHDLTAPLNGAGAGPLAGLTAAVKDMYDVAGYRTGGGSPEWLEAHPAAPSTPPPVVCHLPDGATSNRRKAHDEFFLQRSPAQ